MGNFWAREGRGKGEGRRVGPACTDRGTEGIQWERGWEEEGRDWTEGRRRSRRSRASRGVERDGRNSIRLRVNISRFFLGAYEPTTHPARARGSERAAPGRERNKLLGGSSARRLTSVAVGRSSFCLVFRSRSVGVGQLGMEVKATWNSQMRGGTEEGGPNRLKWMDGLA